MNTKKVLKVIGIILLITFAMFLVHTIKNTIIISNLQKKAKEYANSDNYHVKIVRNDEKEGSIYTCDYYKKGNKRAVLSEIKNKEGESTKLLLYDNGERIDSFTETKDSKTASIGKVKGISMGDFEEVLKTDNIWQTFIYSIPSTIRSKEVNGKKCKLVNGFNSPYSIAAWIVEEGIKVDTYVDKETGLLIKMVAGDIIEEREYEFNSVDDSIFAEPDISQYTITNDIGL